MHRASVVIGALSVLLLSYATRNAAAFQTATTPPPPVYTVGEAGIAAPKLIKEVKPSYNAAAMSQRPLSARGR